MGEAEGARAPGDLRVSPLGAERIPCSGAGLEEALHSGSALQGAALVFLPWRSRAQAPASDKTEWEDARADFGHPAGRAESARGWVIPSSVQGRLRRRASRPLVGG